MAETVVEMAALRKAFNVGKPNETEILHGIDFTLARGEFCAMMGPSGSGKSTLLNIVGLLDRPTAGRLSICGQDTTLLGDAALTRLRGHAIGFVFQHHHLISAFTAVENVMMPMLADKGFADDAMRRHAEDLLERVDLSPWKDSLVDHLSGGQQQRVSVARALVMSPALVLADEPTGNLDTKSADKVFSLLRQVNREYGTAILFVTHNPDLARRCDWSVRVVDGLLDRGPALPPASGVAQAQGVPPALQR